MEKVYCIIRTVYGNDYTDKSIKEVHQNEDAAKQRRTELENTWRFVKNCPQCDNELEYKDWFGQRIEWNDLHNEPIISHEGDIYYCQKCEQNYYTFGDSPILREGYPC